MPKEKVKPLNELPPASGNEVKRSPARPARAHAKGFGSDEFVSKSGRPSNPDLAKKADAKSARSSRRVAPPRGREAEGVHSSLKSVTGYLVGRVSHLFQSYSLANYITAAGPITPMESGMLLAIRESGTLTPTALARAMNVRKPGVMHAVRRLVEIGCLERAPHAADGRSHTLGLTPKGEIVAAEVVKLNAHRDEVLLASLSISEREMFRDLLRRVIAARNSARP